MIIVRRWIVVSLHRQRKVGYGNFCRRLCKSSEYRHPSTRTSFPADFADSQNLEGSPSEMVIVRRWIVVSLHSLSRDGRWQRRGRGWRTFGRDTDQDFAELPY
ncbi:hypothetical protein DPMN_179492 [Dreissena polymorpha]|uniref:Uncharacterized protein n=1 Tax=Dreissena polymorpha TaxID=45954 RepID=A0A9D4IM78_DREPO|nr:hypothetical protein DPMN_179492 [Dreissena polymorpha]